MTLGIVLNLRDDGTVEFLSSDRDPLPPQLVRLAREQLGSTVQRWLEEEAAKINGEAALEIHRFTPPPTGGYSPSLPLFDDERPTEPLPPQFGFWSGMWRPRRRRIEERHLAEFKSYHRKLAAWESRWKAHEAEKRRQADLAVRSNAGSIDAMSTVLQKVLQRIEWPRETAVSFDFGDDATTLQLDIDLPEIADMPIKDAAVAARGVRLLIRDRSDAKRRADYARHVHAVGLRVLGEAFAALPAVHEIVVSAYSQRADPATGAEVDDYLYSARVSRNSWQGLDFARLSAVDPILAFERFELKRAMDRRFNFTAIEPLAACPSCSSSPSASSRPFSGPAGV